MDIGWSVRYGLGMLDATVGAERGEGGGFITSGYNCREHMYVLTYCKGELLEVLQVMMGVLFDSSTVKEDDDRVMRREG